MASIEVKASNPKTEQEAVVSYDFGDNLTEAIESYGHDPVFSLYVAQGKVALQAGLRRTMEAGKDPVEFAAGWKPGVKAPSISADPMSAAKAAYARMSDEEKADFLQGLKE